MDIVKTWTLKVASIKRLETLDYGCTGECSKSPRLNIPLMNSLVGLFVRVWEEESQRNYARNVKRTSVNNTFYFVWTVLI